MHSRSRGALSPEVCIFVAPSENRGRREDRVRAAPAVSRAIAHRKRAHEHTGSAGTLRPSLRSGFTACFVLSPVNGSFATVAPKKLASRELDASTAASGPHDFAVRIMRARLARDRVHRISPRVRDVRTPLKGETRGIKSLICPTARAEYFCEGGWTAQITLNHLAKFTSRRNPFFSIFDVHRAACVC